MSDNRASSPQEERRQRRQQQQERKQNRGGPSGEPCPVCEHLNPPGARYCEECGAPLGGLTCHNCGAVMPPDGDLCEVCGAWLKENECSFCGAELLGGAAFCGECGNPVGGATCPNCGSLSYFDYCPNCHAPLTEQVDEMVAALQQSEPHRRYFEAKQSYADAQVEIRALEAEVEEAEKATATAEASAEDAAILDDLKELNQRRRANRSSAGDRKAPERQKVEQPAQKEEPKIEPEQVRQSAKKENQDALAERKQRLAALKQRQAELEQVIENPPARPKEFSSNQELRRYFMAVKPPHPKGWICDAFNVLHQDPMHCTKPGGGGRWVS